MGALQKPKLQSGFTLVELLVVISILAVMSTLLVINFNATRGSRSIKIAQSQLVTNLRKTQSFILSARQVAANTPAKFYVLRLDLNSNQYLIQSIDTSYNANLSMETLKLPANVTVSGITVPGCSGSCAMVQVAFAAPTGKIYAYSASDSGGSCSGVASLVAAVQNPGCFLSLSDRQVTVTLSYPGTASKTVTVYGLSGTVVAN